MKTLPIMAILGLTLISALAAGKSPASRALAPNPECIYLFHDACSEAVGAWLPHYVKATWDNHAATTVNTRDAFIYEHRIPSENGFFLVDAPRDGTFFVYGNAGPPKGYAVYDYTHRIVYYSQGCCAWSESVLASDVSLPPKHFVARNLSHMRTMRGMRLGLSPAAVQRVYGRAMLRPVPEHRDLSALQYVWHRSIRTQNEHVDCAQAANFIFRSGKLIMLQFANAC